MPSTKTPRYKYKPPKAEMRAIDPWERHPLVEGAASGLGYLRDLFDSGNLADTITMGPMRRLLHGEPTRLVPPTTHSGVGTLMMGSTPEELHTQAAGFSPFSEDSNYGNILDPRIKPGREQGVMDLALTGADIGGLAGLAGRGVRGGIRAAYPTLNPEVNMSRREFLGNTGKVAGGLAAASVLPLALRGAEHAAPVAAHTVAAAARGATHAEFQAAKELARLRAIRAMDLAGLPRYGHIIEADGIYKRTLEDEMAKIKNNPHFKDFESIDDIRAREGQELNELEINYVASRDRQNPHDGADYGEDWENYLHRRQEVEDKHYKIMEEYDKKHGYINNNEVYTRMTEDPNFKYFDPYSHNELTWVKFDKDKHEWVKTEYNPNSRLRGDTNPYVGSTGQRRGYINPEDGLAYPNSINRHTHPELSAEYYEKYLRDRGVPHAAGGSVTMPNNYRAGGRVRMI